MSTKNWRSVVSNQKNINLTVNLFSRRGGLLVVVGLAIVGVMVYLDLSYLEGLFPGLVFLGIFLFWIYLVFHYLKGYGAAIGFPRMTLIAPQNSRPFDRWTLFAVILFLAISPILAMVYPLD